MLYKRTCALKFEEKCLLLEVIYLSRKLSSSCSTCTGKWLVKWQGFSPGLRVTEVYSNIHERTPGVGYVFTKCYTLYGSWWTLRLNRLIAGGATCQLAIVAEELRGHCIFNFPKDLLLSSHFLLCILQQLQNKSYVAAPKRYRNSLV